MFIIGFGGVEDYVCVCASVLVLVPLLLFGQHFVNIAKSPWGVLRNRGDLSNESILY